MFTGSLPLRFFYREILLANSAQKTCSSVGYTSKIRRILDAWQQTHNLEVPGSSPGWSTRKESPKWRFFFVIACTFTSWLSPSFMVRSNFVDNEPSVDGSLRDKSQAQAGPQEKNRPNGGSLLCYKPVLCE